MVRRRRIRYAPTLSSVGSYYSLSQRDRKIMKPKHNSKYYRIDDEDLSRNNRNQTPELIQNNSHSPHDSLMNNYNQQNNYSSSDDIVIAASSSNNNLAKQNNKNNHTTPPPNSLINDTYLDELIGERNKSEGNKTALKRKSVQHHVMMGNNQDVEDEVNSDDDIMDDIKLDHEQIKEKKRKKKKDKKSKRQRQISSNFSMEHSISATVPDSEFSAHELPLRTDNSEFFIIDGVAIHYCLEKNYNENVIKNDDLPWIILLHGYGGGVFSWKRAMPMIFNDMNDNIKGILAFDRVGFGLTERPLTNDEDPTDPYYDDMNSNLGQAITPSDKPISKKLNNKEDENNPYSIHFALKVIKTFVDKFEMNKCILIGHSTGGLIANWFAYHYPSYCDALILISPTTGMPTFIRSILKTKLGKPIILSLVRSEIGNVTLHQAWHNPQIIPSSVIHSYKQVLKLKNWNESLMEMAKVKPYSNSSKYHKSLSMIQCPVWLLHGDDDKLVSFRESISLSQYFKYSFGPIKLQNCGHIPHEEIPKEFTNIIQNIITEQLVSFKKNKNSYQLNEENEDNDEESDDNILNKGAQKFKKMIKNININIGKKNNDNNLKLRDNQSNIPLKNDQSINNSDVHIKINDDEQQLDINDDNDEEEEEDGIIDNETNIGKVTESSALLSE